MNAYRFLSTQLRRTVRHVSALCEIDAAVVRAQRECSSAAFPANVAIIASLMRQLAENWERHQTPERADAFYEKAYAIYGLEGATDLDLLLRMRVAQRWMHLKLRLGDHQSAKELAYVQAELARWQHDMGVSPSVNLVGALALQADMLDRLGDTSTARAVRQEADALAEIPTQCLGYCDPDRDGTIGGAREKR